MCKKLTHSLLFVLLLSLCLPIPVRADLVGYWRFDDGAGTTAVDSSGNGNDGALSGGAQWVIGQLGQAIQFNGSDARVVAPNIPLNSRSFTIMMWVNPVLYTGEQVVFSTGLTGSNDTDMHFRLGGAGSGNVPAGGVRMGFYNNDLDTAGGLIQDNTWYHLAFWYDFPNRGRKIYVNGVQQAQQTSVNPYLGTSGSTVIGAWGTGQWFRGIIDDVQIYNEALADAQIQAAMKGLGGYPLASSPDPKDGAVVMATWVSLNWRAGDFAASHDVYLGESFEDVNAGTGETFRTNQPESLTSFFVGLGLPGDPYPAGLVPGTTYYWRIDEVNQADPNSPWKGPVWSFSIPPRTASNPSPADGAKFIKTDGPALIWSPGLGTKLHYVHFGDNYDQVANATGGSPRATATFTPPSTLEPGKTYYWRVDEFDLIATYKGPVWSFTTAKTGGGVKGQYFRGMNFENLVLTRTDPQINFNWGDPGGPDPSVGNDDFSARWTGEVEAAFTETYTFYARADDGVRLWVDGVQLVNAWVNQGATEYSGTLDLVAGNTYSVVMEYYENTGGAVAELRWSSPRTPKELIPQAALSFLVHASGHTPVNGATGVSQNPILRWRAGAQAASHQVYLGTDPNAVKNATQSSPEYRGTQALSSESYAAANLAWATTYYWRIDEVNNVNPGSPWAGKVVSFTTADYGVVDDFEYYNDIPAGQPGSNLVYMTWLDGYGTTTNGSTMGYPTGASMETINVHGGSQAVPVLYNNAGTAAFSEVERTFAAQNWTDNGITTLSVWFHGDPASVPGQLYVKINGVKVPYSGDMNNLKKPLWQLWNIPLASAGVNLQSVTKLAIGVDTKGATGTLLLDDISLYPTAPAAAEQVWLEAEAGNITAPLTVRADPLASGGSYIGTDDGVGDENNAPPATGVATYSFTAQGGVYQISLRVIITGGSNSFWLRIPDATSYDPGTHSSGWIRFNDISDGAAWHWDDVHSSDHGNQVVKITLAAGQHTLEIARREDGAMLDAIVITAVQ